MILLIANIYVLFSKYAVVFYTILAQSGLIAPIIANMICVVFCVVSEAFQFVTVNLQ
jgi:hypothetical protein